MRIAELCYKLNKVQEAFLAMNRIEDELRDTDKYILYLLKGKCYDKIRKYVLAVNEYKKALAISEQNGMSKEVIG